MQKKFLAPVLVLVALLTLLAFFGVRAAEVAPAISLAQEAPSGDKREVYLTFDDGPSTSVTERILDVLKEEKIKATFFIVSDRVFGREETLKRTAREGHTLGVHSATHEYRKIYASDEALLKDAETCRKVIFSLTGISPAVYRFPGGGGSARERQSKLLQEHGFRVVRWNAVCGDEEIPHADAKTLVRETIKTSAGKSSVVLLMHDSYSHKATAQALPEIIAYFRKEGYSFRAF